MITDEKKKLLALHRLQQATESLEEVRYLFNGVTADHAHAPPAKTSSLPQTTPPPQP